jgi:MFS family permease
VVVEQAGSPWAPLASRVFRGLWLAVLVSNLGTWMQTVGAQWLLVGDPHASTLVSLVQTASSLPVVLLALPSGVLADTFDRRRLLLSVQLFQATVGAALTVLSAFGQLGPALLLVFTFALGSGAALTGPAFAALTPELVPRSQLGSAAALGSVNVNLARAVGPALAGLLVARLGVTAVFAVNTLSFMAYAAVLGLWRPAAAPDGELPERFLPALRAGGRYVRWSPVVRRILFRCGTFSLPATALWALLPLVASRRLHLGAGGYGLLLAALGVGAVTGAVLLPRLRSVLSINRLIAGAMLVYTVALVVVVTVANLAVVLVILLPTGAMWVIVLSTLNASMQVFLPPWVRARGLAMYQMVQAGAMAGGGLAWGVLAQQLGLVPAFGLAAVLMVLAAGAVVLLPLHDTGQMDTSEVAYWPDPELVVEPQPDAGPVVVSTTYTVRPEHQSAFVQAMRAVRRSRHRTGAIRWGLFREGESPDTFVEIYVVGSWQEHLRQHSTRLAGYDRAAEARAVAYSDPAPTVVHLVPPDLT